MVFTCFWRQRPCGQANSGKYDGGIEKRSDTTESEPASPQISETISAIDHTQR